MTRHLQKCGQAAEPTNGPTDFFHLFVEGRHDKDYWLHLALPVDASLSTLDGFLRRAWLECCGHLSAFTVGAQRYASRVMEEFDDLGMSYKLNRVLSTGTTFRYEYDFGSTTELNLKVVGLRAGTGKTRKASLLARNEPPPNMCDQCDKSLATQICTQCSWNGEGWLCDGCAADHECDEEMFLPVVNSPRTGVCGYAG